MSTLRSLFDTGRMKFNEFFRPPVKPPVNLYRKRRFIPSKAFVPMETIYEESQCDCFRQPPPCIPTKRPAIPQEKAKPKFVVHEDGRSKTSQPKECPKSLGNNVAQTIAPRSRKTTDIRPHKDSAKKICFGSQDLSNENVATMAN